MLIFKKIPDELDSYQGDIVVAVVGSDEKPLRSTNAWVDWRLYGSVTGLLERNLFNAELGEKIMLPTYSRFSFDRLVIIGGGELFTHEAMPHTPEGKEHWRKIAQAIAETADSLRVENLGLSLPRYEVAEQEKALLNILKSAHLPSSTSLFLSRSSGRASLSPATLTA